MVRKLTLICAVAVALLIPIQAFAKHGGGSGGRHSGLGWQTAVRPGADGTSVRDGAAPNGVTPVGMAVPGGVGTGGVGAGGEVMG